MKTCRALSMGMGMACALWSLALMASSPVPVGRQDLEQDQEQDQKQIQVQVQSRDSGHAQSQDGEQDPEAGPRLIDVQKIWDQAPHNAFTDLARFGQQWVCVFREGAGHVSPDGALRVIVSDDGRQWRSAARLESAVGDLRDAKIAITPTGQLMLSGAVAWHDRSQSSHQSLTWFSDDAENWSEAHEIGDPDVWMWGVTWENDMAFSIGYSTAAERFVRLYRSRDGQHFESWVDRLSNEGYPNESAVVFHEDQAFCLLRRDGQPATALWGTAPSPYRDWTWQDTQVPIGGPSLIRLPDGRWVATVRLYDQRVRTSLCWVDPQTASLTEFLELPSGGDTSYAGMVWHDQELWISYYSSHEGKSNIYLARVALP